MAVLLLPFGRVRPGEAPTAALLFLSGFLLLAASYVLKVVREPLILLAAGAEVKSYAAALQALLLLLGARLYARLAASLSRVKLIAAVHLFFVANLCLFYVLGRNGLSLGVPFFIWVGIFNVTAVAQFWSFAADIFDREQGQRLFGIVGIGVALGAVAGAHAAGALFRRLGAYDPMLIACGLIVASLAALALANTREQRTASAETAAEASAAVGHGAAFRLVFTDRYLLLVGAITLLVNSISTTGEYILDRSLLAAAHGPAAGASPSEFIGSFRASFFGWVNLAGLAVQAFLVSRVMQHLGVHAALYLAGIVSLGGYASMAALPVLAVVASAKIAENSVGYSLQNTARQALFLVTSREAKYTGKTIVETLVWRTGDVLAAGLVWAGSRLLLGPRHFIWINLVLVLVLLATMAGTARLYQARGGPRLAPGS